jgi:hypothetical protein
MDVRSRNFPENPDADQILVIREADYLREAQDQDDTLKHIKKTKTLSVANCQGKS